MHFVSHITSAASKRIYWILSLKRARCDDDILFSLYIALIRPNLLYAFPAVCSMSAYQRNRLESVERRFFRIINCERKFPILFSVGDKNCQNIFLFKVTNNVYHPLRQFLVIILTAIFVIFVLFVSLRVRLNILPIILLGTVNEYFFQSFIFRPLLCPSIMCKVLFVMRSPLLRTKYTCLSFLVKS